MTFKKIYSKLATHPDPTLRIVSKVGPELMDMWERTLLRLEYEGHEPKEVVTAVSLVAADMLMMLYFVGIGQTTEETRVAIVNAHMDWVRSRLLNHVTNEAFVMASLPEQPQRPNELSQDDGLLTSADDVDLSSLHNKG
jgi:hypothetical protein